MLRNRILSVFFLIFCLSCNAQYKKVPTNLDGNARIDAFRAHQFINIKESNKYVDITNYLPKNYSKNGNVDYTSYVQRAINENQFLKFPNFPILINNNGIRLKSNSKLAFQELSKILIIPTHLGAYQGLLVENIFNVEIINPNIVGERKYHIGSKGEWGMGILIRNSKNITISGAIIENCWGDGIYVGATGSKFSEDIKISNSKLDYNRRNGISIVSGKAITISDVLISNTQGTSPGFGIDLEPNNHDDILEEIKIINYISFNNNVGLGIVLDNIIGDKKKNINISCFKITDKYSNSAIELFVDRGYRKYSENNIYGDIEISNVNGFNNRNVIVLHKSRKSNINLSVKEVIISRSDTSRKLNSTELNLFRKNIKSGIKTEF